MIILRIILLPISLIYSFCIFLRNRCYDLHLLPSKSPDAFTVAIGNLTVGGTGKTPFTAHVLEKVFREKVAFLSRGYGRKTKGLIKVDSKSTALEIGDEPLLIHRRFSSVPAVVSENRMAGVEAIMNMAPQTEAIILDDAYQHRQLHADVYILLCDYNRPIWNDCMLPSGRLRDNRIEKRRAAAIIISKCPSNISQPEMDLISKKMKLRSRQRIFFTSVDYGNPCPANELAKSFVLDEKTPVVGLAGIAQPQLFSDFLKSNFNQSIFLRFPDHHSFSKDEVDQVLQQCSSLGAIVMTEKDAMRWSDNSTAAFYIPISVRFIKGEEQFSELLRKAQLEKMKSRY